MSGGEHRTIPFSQLHKARVLVGLATSLTINGGATAAEGPGDLFYGTDDGILYICKTGVTWEVYGGGGGGLSYDGTRRERSSDFPVNGADAGDYLDFNQENWDVGGLYGSGVSFYTHAAGIYSYSLSLQLENLEPARWHIELWIDDDDTLAMQADVQADGTGEPLWFQMSGQFNALKEYPADNGYAYIYIYHDGVNPMNVKTYSNMVVQYLGELP